MQCTKALPLCIARYNIIMLVDSGICTQPKFQYLKPNPNQGEFNYWLFASESDAYTGL